MMQSLAVGIAPNERVGEAPKRVDPCPCGSGLKYKDCCGLAVPVQLPTPDQADQQEAKYRHLSEQFQKNPQDKSIVQGVINLLQDLPTHARSLRLLAKIKQQQQQIPAAEVLLRRAQVIRSNDSDTNCELGMLLYQQRKFDEAFIFIRNGIRTGPNNAQAHNLMGMLETEQNHLLEGEFHYRRVLELTKPLGGFCANFGLNLKKQGRLDESTQWYEKAIKMEPENISSLLGFVSLEEVKRNFDRAESLLGRAEKLQPSNPAVTQSKATLFKRKKQYDEALTTLDSRETEGVDPPALIPYYYERGDILDKMQRYDEAFIAYDKANHAYREAKLREYNQPGMAAYVGALKQFFTRSRNSSFACATEAAEGQAKPLFIIGYPRSGTTMTEQMLSAHPAINAGDELRMINELPSLLPELLRSGGLGYPNCLADLWLGSNIDALETSRDYYLRKANRLGITGSGANWFTDKMPLNETHLGLIHLIFPKSPVVHLLRHPLDVVLSCFFNDLSHGGNMSYDLVTAAQHYVLIRDLVDHYLLEMDVNYLPVKYEDIVDDPEKKIREMLTFIGEPWDESCLEFHQNTRYARTASYAQVTEKLYTRSRYRYKNYFKQLEPIIPILEPVIEKLGYDISPD